MGFLEILPTLINGGLGVADTILRYKSNQETNQTNQDNINATNTANIQMNDANNSLNQLLTRETNKINYDIAQNNLQFQQDNLDYQKALQQQIFEREDTSYARTVNDMRNAGLSPLNINGTNGAGTVINTQAMNNSYQHQNFQAEKNYNQAFQAINEFTGLSEALIQAPLTLQQTLMQLQRDKSTIAKEQAETNYTTSQKNAFERMIPYDEERKRLENKTIEDQIKDFEREYKHREDSGLYKDDTQIEHNLKAIGSILSNDESTKKLQQEIDMITSNTVDLISGVSETLTENGGKLIDRAEKGLLKKVDKAKTGTKLHNKNIKERK